MTREERVESIKSIEQARNSRLVTLVTSDRENLMAHIHQKMNDYVYEELRAIKTSGDEFESLRSVSLQPRWR